MSPSCAERYFLTNTCAPETINRMAEVRRAFFDLAQQLDSLVPDDGNRDRNRVFWHLQEASMLSVHLIAYQYGKFAGFGFVDIPTMSAVEPA